MRGTATRWQNHHLPGTAFVVELPGGELPSSAARRHARAAAKVARSGAGRRKLGSGGAAACRRPAAAERGSREAAAAADRPRPDPVRAGAKAPDGRLLSAPLRPAQVAPPPSPGDRAALHRRAQLQIGVGDIRLQRPQPGRAARGLLALRGRKAWAHPQGRQATDPVPAHDRPQPPLARDRDGPGGWARLALGRPPDPSPRPPDPCGPASGRLAEAALRDQAAKHHRPRDGQRQPLLQGPPGMAERPHGLAAARRADVPPPACAG